MRSWGVCAWVLAAAGSVLLAASAEARSSRLPDPGNWEGKGPHGLALSFQLARTRSGPHAQALAVTVPAGCPADVRNALAVAGTTKTIYSGPGAAPPGLSHPIGTSPGTMGLTLNAPQFRVLLEGSLVDHRRAVLTMGRPAGGQMTCWPRALRFEARSAPRISVMDG